MNQPMLFNYNKDILAFAQQWRTGTISPQEMDELNNWFYALEGISLGCPDELTVEKVEKRLHEQFWKDIKETDSKEGPPHPWHPKS